jgi:predicted DNA-binding protein
MSTPDTTPGGVKTLAIRLQPDVHQQLVIIASLRGTTISEEIRQAIEAHIASVKSSTDLASKADGVLEEIERQAADRRAAIASLFGDGTAAPTSTPKGRGRAAKPAADA